MMHGSGAPSPWLQRWAHLLCGPLDAAAMNAASDPGGPPGTGNHLARIERLEAEVAQLRDTVQKLCSELGLSPPGQP